MASTGLLDPTKLGFASGDGLWLHRVGAVPYIQLLLHLTRDPHVSGRHCKVSEKCCQEHLSPEIFCLTIKQFILHYYDEMLISVIFIIWRNILAVCVVLSRCHVAPVGNIFNNNFSLLILKNISLWKALLILFRCLSPCNCANMNVAVCRWTWSCECNGGIRTGGNIATVVGRWESKFRKAITICAMSVCISVCFCFCRSLCLSISLSACLLSVCLSVCLSTWNIAAPIEVIFGKLYVYDFGFWKYLQIFFKNNKNNRHFYINPYVNFRQYLSELFLEWEIF
jgi:hypothetical protein